MEAIDREILELIRKTANERIDTVFSELGIDIDLLYCNGNNLRGKCPVHDGDNASAFSFNVDTGCWKCYTRNCQENHWNIFGLIQLIKEVNYPEAIKWLAGILEIPLKNAVPLSREEREFSQEVYKLRKKTTKCVEKSRGEFPIPLKLLKDKIKPSQYFLNQGFSEETLKKYYVGSCDDSTKPMFLRSYSLVLDDIGQDVIGITGRTELDKCDICGSYHIQGRGCPVDNPKIFKQSKWFHYKFDTRNSLYSVFHSKEQIKKTKTAVLVESTKNVWWFDQHGIYNSLCCFGLNILEPQIKKLLSLNVMKVVLGTDNDEAGLEGLERLEQQLGNYFKVVKIQEFMKKDGDICDINSEDMGKYLVPFLRKQ